MMSAGSHSNNNSRKRKGGELDSQTPQEEQLFSNIVRPRFDYSNPTDSEALFRQWPSSASASTTEKQLVTGERAGFTPASDSHATTSGGGAFVQYIPYTAPPVSSSPQLMTMSSLQYPSASAAVNAILSLHNAVDRSATTQQSAFTGGKGRRRSRAAEQQAEEDDVDQMLSFEVDEEDHVGAKLEDKGSDEMQEKEKSKVTFKRSCKVCTERRVKCSGPPGPCVTCMKKGLAKDMCVFLPRRKPGPKKREFDLLLGLSSTLALTDEQFISESVHLVFGEYAVSLQVANVLAELRSHGFVAPSEDWSSFPNEAYAKKCALKAVRLWLTLFGEHTLDIASAEFVHLMKSYQETSENFELDDRDLEKLFWLCSPNDEMDESSRNAAMIAAPPVQPRMMLTQLCLAFMWLGPSNSSTIPVAPSKAVRDIYDWLHADPERIENYEGFASPQYAEMILNRKPERRILYFLHEGRVDSIKSGLASRKNMYRIRCLGKTFFKEDESGNQMISHEMITL